MFLQHIPLGVWFSMSNGSLVTALLISFCLGFAAGVVCIGWMNGRRKK